MFQFLSTAKQGDNNVGFIIGCDSDHDGAQYDVVSLAALSRFKIQFLITMGCLRLALCSGQSHILDALSDRTRWAG